MRLGDGVHVDVQDGRVRVQLTAPRSKLTKRDTHLDVGQLRAAGRRGFELEPSPEWADADYYVHTKGALWRMVFPDPGPAS